MKRFFVHHKNLFSKKEKTDALNLEGVIKRVDDQIGRAVTRLADR
jgi:hypothetical protein